MEKKRHALFLVFFLVAFVLIIFANILVIYKFFPVSSTAKASSSQGTVQLTVEGEEILPTPAPTPTPGTVGGGGGAAVSLAKDFFSVEPSLIKVVVKRGESFKTQIKIKNTYSQLQQFKIDAGELKDLIIFSEDIFSLESGEEKVVYLTFYTSSVIKLGVHLGKIKISTALDSKYVSVIAEIKSEKVLFDVSLNIPSKYREVLPGEELLIQLTLFNLGEVEKADVSLEFQIKDFEGNTIVKKEDIAAVETQASLSKTFVIPKEAKEGQYVAVVDVKYDESFGTSSDIFYVVGKKKIIGKEYVIFAIILLIIISSIIASFYYTNRKLKKVLKEQVAEIKGIARRIEKGHMKMAEAIKMLERLRLQISVLNKAYEKGYISREAYEKGKTRLNNLAQELKKKYL